jgi:hypothetical protein
MSMDTQHVHKVMQKYRNRRNRTIDHADEPLQMTKGQLLMTNPNGSDM